MTAMAPWSSIDWLNFGEEEQRRTCEYLAQFERDNTFDKFSADPCPLRLRIYRDQVLV